MMFRKAFPYKQLRRIHVCEIATARIDYRAKDDEVVLNTTIKSGVGIGKIFAPTWDIVLKLKNKEITWDTYTKQYKELMYSRYDKSPLEFLEALKSTKLVVCCYCIDTSHTIRHCHRYILVDILTEIGRKHGVEVVYVGEVYNPKIS